MNEKQRRSLDKGSDPAGWLVLADWHEEEGRDEEAHALRRRAALVARMLPHLADAAALVRDVSDVLPVEYDLPGGRHLRVYCRADCLVATIYGERKRVEYWPGKTLVFLTDVLGRRRLARRLLADKDYLGRACAELIARASGQEQNES